MKSHITPQIHHIDHRDEKSSLRIAFLFTSSREELIARVKTGQDADTALHGLNYINGAEHFIISPKSMRAVSFIPRLLRYDFVITQDNLLLGYVVSLCARALRLKTRWLYIAINSSTLMRRHAAHPVRLFLLKRFWASYTRIICISSKQLEDFLRLGILRERLAFIPLGVDADFFESAMGFSEGDLIASVGRDMGRDYRTLFEAAADTTHKFVVVAARENIAADISILQNVSVLYNRTLPEIRDWYARSRLVVIASKDAGIPEGSDCSGQTVILDALAAGKAVIATHRSWIADYFIDGEDLIVVPPNNPGAIVRAIDSLWNDTEKRKHLASSGHEKVITRYTTKAFAKALLRLMNSAL